MKKRRVVVIGGGASGILAAISAARCGANVTLVEQRDRLGKKILSTGNGRCNLTNEYMDISCFRGDDLSIVSPILEQFDNQNTIRFFEEIGVLLKNRNGYIYPITDQASTILDALCMELSRLNVEILLEQYVTEVTKTAKGFSIKTTTQTINGDAIILATGSKAAPMLGSDGSGYEIAKQFGHRLSPVVPALVQLKCKGSIFKKVAGVRTNAKVTLLVDNIPVASDIGELQLTNYGISGIPVFQISRFASKGLYENKNITAELDLIPHMTDEEWNTFLSARMKKHGYKKASDFFTGIFHTKLIDMLLYASHISNTTVMNTITQAKLQILSNLCKHFKVEVVETNGFEQAQICAGGVRTEEINEQTLESRYVTDFYITGEILDIDGICGGYNLQWAWSTGFVAGKNAAKGM